ncbi:uncharacterized protein LOC141718964 [Apium graveolens]|uniref:uncharacterized protein LOC141718964 n=1 Tax=Apium graveolens TaxID=4045 RepID=UPI003D7AB258
MMLNPANCAFKVGSGKYLGLMLSKRGIEANTDKIKAILGIEPLHSIKDVQKHTKRVTSLGRFIFKSGDKCISFFNALKKVKDFAWTDESSMAFEELKKYMVQASLLEKPVLDETLCLRPDEVRLALEEVHRGIYGQHLGGRALPHKITRLGFYWSEMMTYAKYYVKRCDRCQKHALVVMQPPEMLTSINTPIPFSMWGMDILGPFPMATAQMKFLIVAIDYFTKWIEAKPLAKITTKQVAQFLCENIMCRYRIPHILVTDNGIQFNNEEFNKYCDGNEIELGFTLSLTLRPKAKQRVTTGETPFMLTYGAKAVVTVEISHSSPRIRAYNTEENEEGQRLAMDLIDEVRDQAHAKIMAY